MLWIFECDGRTKMVGNRWIPAFAGMTTSGLPHGTSFDLQNAPQLLRSPLDRPLVQRAMLPLGQLYLLRILEVVHEDRIHLRAESCVQHVEIGFVVERKRAVVEVHRSH